MTARRITAPNEKALAAFLAAKAEIDAQLERVFRRAKLTP